MRKRMEKKEELRKSLKKKFFIKILLQIKNNYTFQRVKILKERPQKSLHKEQLHTKNFRRKLKQKELF